MQEAEKCCQRDFDNDGNCDSHPAPCCRQKPYDPDDVTTWTAEEFESKAAAKLRTYWNKIETIKYLIRDGKVWVAGEQIQGLSDGVAFLVKLFEERVGSHGNQDSNAGSGH